MIRAEDFLWNVKAQERLVIERIDRQIATISAALQAANEVVALAANRNFQSFLGKLVQIQDDAISRLRDHQGPDHEVRVLQGRCQAIQDVVDLCQGAKIRAEDLAKKLEAAQAERARVVRADGFVVPPGINP